jgi:membrane associated rhomboid family serine protease
MMQTATARIIVVILVVTTSLLILMNASPGPGRELVEALVLSAPNTLRGFVWTFFTYALVNLDPRNLIWTLLLLFFFGRTLEPRWGPKSLLRFVALSAAISGAFTALLQLAIPPLRGIPMTGLHAVTNALVIAFALYHGRQQINIWGVLPIEGRHLLWMVAFFEVLFALAGEWPLLPMWISGFASGWLLVTGKWRPSRWGIGRGGGGSGKPKRPNPGNLRVIKGSREDEDEDDDERPPKYLN